MSGVVGPFHSLSESDRRGLVALVGSGRSVRSAAGELGCHYGHALNFCHAFGLPVVYKAKRVDRRGSQAVQLVELVRCQMRVFGTGVLGTRYCRVPGSWYRAEGYVGPGR